MAIDNKAFDRKLIIEGAVKRFGELHQIDRAIEEMGELIVALQKFRRALDGGHKFYSSDVNPLVENIKGEVADVKVTMKSLNVIFGETEDIEEYKIQRLRKRMEPPPKLFDELE